MATYFARKSGNINATDVWATTPSGTAGAVTFASGDVLLSNSFTVTVNVSTDLGATGEVRNDTTGGATAGGSFTLSSGVTLTANVYAGTATCLNHSSGSSTIVGNITGGTSSNAYGVQSTSSGTLTITGSITGGTGSSTFGCIQNSGSNTVNVTGNITGGTGGAGFYANASAAILNVTGNVTASTQAGLVSTATGVITVTGTVTAATGRGIDALGSSTITVVGTCIGATGIGASNSAGGILVVTRAKGGPLAGSAVGVAGASGSGYASVEEVEWGDTGASPTSGPIRLVDKQSNVAVMYRFGTTKKNLVDANASGLMPAASNVRFGTTYNGGNSTGTCYVPSASSVAFGVNVDATTGTAALTPAAVWDYLTSSATTSGSMGERLKSAATVASTGQQLANALTP